MPRRGSGHVLSEKRVVRQITALIACRGRSGMIVSDNGTEFTSSAVLAITASFQGKMRGECLNEHLSSR